MKRISLWTVWKLRFKLWWMFGNKGIPTIGPPTNHRLKIRWNGRLRMWSWIVECYAGPIDLDKPIRKNRKTLFQAYGIGPLQQWSLQEALSLAARKAQWVLHPDQEPVKKPEPNPPQPLHSKVYRLVEKGLIAVECSCGWSTPVRKCHPEQDAASRCETCYFAENAYKQHESDSSNPNIWEAAVDRGPWIAHQTWNRSPE